MAKTLGIITMDGEAGKSYRRQIADVFGEEVEVQLYSVENNTAAEISRADLYLVSKGAIKSSVEMELNLPLDVHVLDLEADFTLEDIRRLKALPKGTRVMFVNTTKFLVSECITRVQQLGVHHLEFYPIYPGVKAIPELPVAVTPGEPELVPEGVETILDLGHRSLGPRLMAEIALELGLKDALESEAFLQYINRFDLGGYFNVHSVLTKSLYIEDCFGVFVESLDDGVVGADECGEIFCFNRKAGEILGRRFEEMKGKNVTEELEFLPFYQSRSTLLPVENTVKKLAGGFVNISVKPIVRDGRFKGIFAVIQKFSEAERKQQEARMQVLNKGHAAKYRFVNIIGESAAIKRTKELALRMAKTDFTILIYGESGTGKELFASAIHNESGRSEYPFIAINCAAMPEQLLESELFGYEEGAFTGAKKGGKLGLFEFAHRGSLFLDEIENMSPALQVKLLRVLQEREVMRVGGTKTISVDVRIIAATNENLEEAVKSGSFRKDLYYRISTLPVELPKLNDRREDVLLLFEYFKSRYGKDFELDDEVKRILISHDWDGNVRELQNYVEFFVCLDKEYITAENLPLPLLRGRKHTGAAERRAEGPMPGVDAKTQPEASMEVRAGDFAGDDGQIRVGAPGEGTGELPDIRALTGAAGRTEVGAAAGKQADCATLCRADLLVHRFEEAAGNRLELYRFVLSALCDGYENRMSLGRGTIAEKARQRGLYLTEQEVRTILNRLQEKGLVSISRGRGGSRLTGDGLELARSMKPETVP